MMFRRKKSKKTVQPQPVELVSVTMKPRRDREEEPNMLQTQKTQTDNVANKAPPLQQQTWVLDTSPPVSATSPPTECEFTLSLKGNGQCQPKTAPPPPLNGPVPLRAHSVTTVHKSRRMVVSTASFDIGTDESATNHTPHECEQEKEFVEVEIDFCNSHPLPPPLKTMYVSRGRTSSMRIDCSFDL